MSGQMWPQIASRQAAILASDWLLFTIAGLAVACFVWGLIFFALVRFRSRSSASEPPQFKNNAPLEIAWTVVPLVLVVGLFLYTYRAEARVDATSDRPDVIVRVDAYRWGWSFRYADGPSVGGAAASPAIASPALPPPEIELPLGKTTRIELSSSDVTHSFWIPDLLFKRDAIPGQVTSFDITPDKLGSFAGRCAQFCGLNHALMAFTVRVVPPDVFERWRKGAKP